MSIRVRAKGNPQAPSQKYAGYYNYVRRKPGDVFDLVEPCPNKCRGRCSKPDKCQHPRFSRKWMEHASPSEPKTPAPGEPTAAEIEEEQRRIAAANAANAGGQGGGQGKPGTGSQDVL